MFSPLKSVLKDGAYFEKYISVIPLKIKAVIISKRGPSSFEIGVEGH